MSRLRYVAYRFGWTVLITVLVLSGVFVVIAAPRDPNPVLRAWAVALDGGNASAALASARSARGLDRSLLVRYLAFMENLLTFQWGTSLFWQRPVAGLVAERGLVTAAYVLPAVLVSTTLGTLVGLYVSIREAGLGDRLASGIAYLGYGLPDFWLALVLATLLSESFFFESAYAIDRGPLAPRNLRALLVPTVALSTTLAAVQLRYVRSETQRYLREEFVRVVRAKGVHDWRVARHAFRNAAIPLVTILFTEFLAVLFISTFVIEAALGLPGLGDLLFTALERRDVPVVMISALIPVLVGVYGNFLQDLLFVVLDPQLTEES